MAPHSSTFAWKIPWTEEPGRLHSPWGRWGSDSTEWLHFHFSLSCIGEGNGNPLQCSCLENPRDGGAWWAAIYGVAQSWTRLKWLNSSSSSSHEAPAFRFSLGISHLSLNKPNGNPLHYSCLENPMGGAWWAAVHGVAKSRTRLSGFTFPFHFHALEKEMATHSNVLAWRIPEMGEPGGLPSVGSHRVGHDWSDLVAAANQITNLIFHIWNSVTWILKLYQISFHQCDDPFYALYWRVFLDKIKI